MYRKSFETCIVLMVRSISVYILVEKDQHIDRYAPYTNMMAVEAKVKFSQYTKATWLYEISVKIDPNTSLYISCHQPDLKTHLLPSDVAPLYDQGHFC